MASGGNISSGSRHPRALRLLVWPLVLVLLAPPPSTAAAADEQPTRRAADAGVRWNSVTSQRPLLASGLRLAAAVEAQPTHRLPRGFRCGVGIPLATAAGAMLGVVVSLVAALADLSTSPERRTLVAVSAGAAVGLGFGIYGCTR